MNNCQLSLMGQFGEIEDPESDRFNAAFDRWRSEFSQFATLDIFRADIRATSQSFEQKEKLIEYVSVDENFKELLAVDFGFNCLNTSFKNYVWSAYCSGKYRIEQEERRARSEAREAALLKEREEAERRALIQKRDVEKLALLELREELLALEKEYPSASSAKKSVYVKKSQQFDDIVPLIERQAHGHSSHNYDELGRMIINTFTYTWKLTFEVKRDNEQVNK